MAFNPPPLGPFQPEWYQFQVWWQQVIEDLKQALEEVTTAAADALAAATAAQAAIDELAEQNSDDILTPAKKPIWIFMHSFLTGEQAGLDAQATSYGITTQKTTYDNAISALTSHLATLTTPVAWNVLTDNTTIVGTTFRTKFNDVMTSKQALINKITAEAKVLADAAQSTATTANTNATTAAADALAVKKTDKISASWTSPGAVLTAADVGTSATITIAAHTRKWGDGTSTAVAGGSITGRSFSTAYYVYYTDTTQSDTTPSYLSTTDPNTAAPNAASGRVYVGKITTPADGGGSTSGGTVPPGGGYSGPTDIP
jgi:hypothetical protein